MRDVFIVGAGAALPGPPVTNADMLNYLGALDDKSERLGKFVLRQNRISTRYYSIDRSGRPTHTCADLAATAVKAALADSGRDIEDLGLLATSTTLGDLLVPGHGSAVHGALGCQPLEIASFQSVCASSMMATRTAYLNVRAGEHDLAVATGAEIAGQRLHARFCEPAVAALTDNKARMSAEFLRWTLSDGGGAIAIAAMPHDGVCLRIDGIRVKSFANQFPPCMFAGAPYADEIDLGLSWSNHPGGVLGAASAGALVLHQNMPMLKDIFEVWTDEMAALVAAGDIVPESTDWLLCHYSAHSLKDEIAGMMEQRGMLVPRERWFSNLSEKGNTGSAAMFIMIEEFMKSGLPKSGQRILCITPESGRALISFMFLTVV